VTYLNEALSSLAESFRSGRLFDQPRRRELPWKWVSFLTAMGLFIGQSKEFFEPLRDLAEDADEARRECH
jgi:hypothetical protein